MESAGQPVARLYIVHRYVRNQASGLWDCYVYYAAGHTVIEAAARLKGSRPVSGDDINPGHTYITTEPAADIQGGVAMGTSHAPFTDTEYANWIKMATRDMVIAGAREPALWRLLP